jgi:hypothetical protein
MKNWYSSIYKSFIIASVICFLINFFTSGETSYGSILTGYSTLTLGILMIMLIIFNNILQVTNNDSVFKIIYIMLMNAGPFMLQLSVIGIMLYLIIYYKNQILSGEVSKGYYTFSNITIILLLLQIYIVYQNINNDKFDTNKKLSMITTSSLYLFGVITLITTLINFSILKYFTADGFTV